MTGTRTQVLVDGEWIDLEPGQVTFTPEGPAVHVDQFPVGTRFRTQFKVSEEDSAALRDALHIPPPVPALSLIHI